MMKPAVLLFAVLPLALLASTAVGQTDATSQGCTWEGAERVSVRALDRNRSDMRGRCVRIIALNDGWALRTRRSSRDGVEETFIGAYFEDGALRATLSVNPRRVESLGVVGHCSDICGNSDPDAICMPVGFCHYRDDPYVLISAVR